MPLHHESIRLWRLCFVPAHAIRPIGLLRGRFLTVSFLDHFRVVMSDRAAGSATEHGMVTGEMAHPGANRRSA
jgi:hypothetical protein